MRSGREWGGELEGTGGEWSGGEGRQVEASGGKARGGTENVLGLNLGLGGSNL